MPFRSISPGPRRGRVAPAALFVVLAAMACGGGGAAVPTEPDQPTVTPPTESTPPADTAAADSTPPTSSAPMTALVTTPDRTFSPGSVTIGAGGTVTWMITDDDHDVTFAGPVPPGGSIPETEEGTAVSRTFPDAGTYPYYCSKHADDGMVGQVVVVAGDGGEGPADAPPSSSATVTTPGTSFSPPSVSLAVGGTVTWSFSGARHNVTFTGAAPEGGNIPDTDPGGSATRTFATPGRYDYTCTRHSGMNGTIEVEDTP